MAQRYLLIDEESAREIWEALKKEFYPQTFERLHGMVRACGEIAAPSLASHRTNGIAGDVRSDTEFVIPLHSYRIRNSSGLGIYIIENLPENKS